MHFINNYPSNGITINRTNPEARKDEGKDHRTGSGKTNGFKGRTAGGTDNKRLPNKAIETSYSVGLLILKHIAYFRIYVIIAFNNARKLTIVGQPLMDAQPLTIMFFCDSLEMRSP